MKLAFGLLSGYLMMQAAVVSPTSYDMPNGYTGSYSYHDETYNGSGVVTSDGAALSGGLGDLTDGIVATDSWFVEEVVANGPYVGWTIDPLITFQFASITDFTTIRIHFDDSDGAGGVSRPASVTINGTLFVVAEPAGSAPFWAEFDVSGLASTDTVGVQIARSNSWVFASEVEFQDDQSTVPEPSTLLVMGSGLAGLALLRRRARA